MPLDSHTVVSVVAPVANGASYLEAFVQEVHAALAPAYRYFEVILVDDASTDSTAQVIPALLQAHERIRYLRLSRAFGVEAAIAAGLDSAVGDFVVVLEPNYDPPALLPELLATTKRTGGILTGVSPQARPRGWLGRKSAGLFRTYCRRFLGIHLRSSATRYQVISRQVVNAIAQLKDQRRYLRVFTTTVGYDLQYFTYQRLDRGVPNPPLSWWQQLDMAVDIVVAHSRHPLRLVSRLGLLVSMLNAAYIGYIGIIYVAKRHVAEGWTTTSLQNTVMFFFLFLILTVVCEYLGRLFEEVQGKPPYFIATEQNSSVLLEHQIKRNIVHASTSHE